MAWIKTQQCIVCGRCPSEAAHCGDRAFSQKAPDNTCLPLCTEHHTEGKVAHHKLGKRFWEYHNLDREALTLSYRDVYLKTVTVAAQSGYR